MHDQIGDDGLDDDAEEGDLVGCDAASADEAADRAHALVPDATDLCVEHGRILVVGPSLGPPPSCDYHDSSRSNAL